MKSRRVCRFSWPQRSLPVRGAWIEMRNVLHNSCRQWSLPVRGAWIEIDVPGCAWRVFAGRSPCGERGLKSAIRWETGGWWTVAPRAGSVD